MSDTTQQTLEKLKTCMSEEELPDVEKPEYFTNLLNNVLGDTNTKLYNLSIRLPRFLKAQKNDPLRMAFFNIGGLTKNKIVQLKYLLFCADLDVLFLIETRVNDASYTALREIDAYKNLRESKKTPKELQSMAGQIHSKYQEFIRPARSNSSGGLMVLLKRETFQISSEKTNLCEFAFLSLPDGDRRPSQDDAAESESDTEEDPENKEKAKTNLPKFYHEVCSIKLRGITYILGYRNNVSGPIPELINDIVKLRPKNDEPFVILGDFNTTNVQWIFEKNSESESRVAPSANNNDFNYLHKGNPRSKAFLEEIKNIGCNKQYIRTATSGRSMRPLDLLFARTKDKVIKEVFVAPFLDKQRVRDHAPVFFLANKKDESKSSSQAPALALNSLSLGDPENSNQKESSTPAKQSPAPARQSPAAAKQSSTPAKQSQNSKKGKK